MVLVIISLIAVGVTALSNSMLISTRSRATAQNATLIQQAIERFIERNGRLPCPAVPGTGVEDTANCNNTALGTTGIARGVVPYSALGLAPEQAQDGYYWMFSYYVTIAATTTTSAPTSATTTNVAAMRGSMTTHAYSTGASPILGPPPAGNQVNTCATATGVDDGNACNQRAVVVLVSHGQNGLGAFTPTGGSTNAPTIVAELQNAKTGSGPYSNVNFFVSGAVDDIVFAWGPNDLIGPLAQQGSLRSAASTTQDQLRTAVAQISNAIGNITCAAAPCSAPYPPAAAPGTSTLTIEGTSITLPMDGWGTATTSQRLLYSSTGGDICTSGSGAIAFTITSTGVDGVSGTNPTTGTNDDVSATVTVDAIKSQINTRFGAGSC